MNVKTNPHNILKAFVINPKQELGILTNGIEVIKNTDITIADRNSVGSSISKTTIFDIFEVSSLSKIEKEEIVEVKVDEKEEVSLEQIDKKILTIDDFLDDFKI